MNADLEALKKRRQRWVDANRENQFEAGILRLLTQLYPDNAHFIYELLQNAEDAGASRAHFDLSGQSLVFAHNGARLFSARDVESITSIGDSTKLDVPTQIGKFGVGFKAVFAYTQTPEIHSGEFHFKIRDLVVPEEARPINLSSSALKTRFVFPFDHNRKRANQAVTEIQRALQALDDATLLFLTSIHRIDYELPGGRAGSVQRRASETVGAVGELIEVAVRHPKSGNAKSHWLRYQRSVAVTDDAVEKTCTIGVAFALAPTRTKAARGQCELASCAPGCVSIYFPAEKEASGLRFHIHAPFASTVARDSVRDCEGNNQLRDHIAALVADALVDLRDRGLLDVAALDVLPTEDDDLSEFYEPIREAIVEAFGARELVPTKSGHHRRIGELFRGPSDILALLTDDDLAVIIDHKGATPLWCANPPQINQRADKFLEGLGIKEWGWEELGDALGCAPLSIVDDPKRPQRLSRWLQPKPDTWLRRFYSLLHQATAVQDQWIDVAELPFVRVEVADGTALVRPREAFFKPHEDVSRTDVQWVRPEVYTSGRAEAQRSAARNYLERAGVTVFDEGADVSRIAEGYRFGLAPKDEDHLEHIRRFVAFFKANPRSGTVFANKKLLFGSPPSGSGKRSLSLPAKLCLDAPFEETGLASVAGIIAKAVLWTGYEKLGLGKDFLEFAKGIGVQSGFVIKSASTSASAFKTHLRQDWHRHRVRWTETAIDQDWTIDQLGALMDTPTIESSRLIWHALIRADRSVARARFRPNQQYETREADSELVSWLRARAWIPKVDGTFCQPQDVSRTELRPDFPYDSRNGLLDAIGFERATRRATEDYKRRDTAARELGFLDLEAAAEVAEAMGEVGISAKDVAALIREHSAKPVQPSDRVRNLDRRRTGMRERRENAPASESVNRERSIQPDLPEVTVQAKAYLRAKYTNADQQMVCQACQREMPFKVSSGDYYFEAVQFVRRPRQSFFELRLALCPNCSAMYQFARAESDDELREAVLACEIDQGADAFELKVELAGMERKLLFVGTHFLDIQTILAEN